MRIQVLLISIVALLLCGCQMATTYGRKPTLCPGTENVYALTVYSNTDSEEVNDRKALEVLTSLMEEKAFNDYTPIMRIQYNTALKFFYVIELRNSNVPSVTSFSERMKAVPKVFGRNADYGYEITSGSKGTNYLTLTTWPSPLDEFLELRRKIISENRGLPDVIVSPNIEHPEASLPALPENMYSVITRHEFLGLKFGFATDKGRGILAVPGVRILTLDRQIVYLPDTNLKCQRVNLLDFIPLIRKHLEQNRLKGVVKGSVLTIDTD